MDMTQLTTFRVDVYNFGQPLRLHTQETEVKDLADLAEVLKNIPKGYDMVIFSNRETSIVMPGEHFVCSIVIPDPEEGTTVH